MTHVGGAVCGAAADSADSVDAVNDVAAASRARTVFRDRLTLLGPALVAAAAYVDPGNVVTNTLAGSRYGYLLVWVVVLANLTAGLVQYLAAKLGIVTGRSLPEMLGDRLGTRGRWAYWAQGEVVSMATDLAEVVGGAVALRILFDVPLTEGAVITTVVSMLVLGAHRVVGGAGLERAVSAMLLIVAVGFVAGVFVRPPHAPLLLAGLRPDFAGGDSLLLAAAMFGATVMPHAIYAHSALARDRHGRAVDARRRTHLLRATRTDVCIALAGAGAVNLALLLLGTIAPADGGGSLEGVHAALDAHVGPVVGLLFAVGLLFSGVASTSVGCYAGSVLVQGLLRARIPVLARRVITAVPAVLVLAAGADPTHVLLVSQLVLSLGIPFALVPLVSLTSRRSVMGGGVNRPLTIWLASGACVVIVTLNVGLVVLVVHPSA